MKYVNITEAVGFLHDALIDAELVGDTEAVAKIRKALELVEPLAE